VELAYSRQHSGKDWQLAKQEIKLIDDPEKKP
jgi:hypothetical protein